MSLEDEGSLKQSVRMAHKNTKAVSTGEFALRAIVALPDGLLPFTHSSRGLFSTTIFECDFIGLAPFSLLVVSRTKEV
jgi:hypothetical protein